MKEHLKTINLIEHIWKRTKRNEDKFKIQAMDLRKQTEKNDEERIGK